MADIRCPKCGKDSTHFSENMICPKCRHEWEAPFFTGGRSSNASVSSYEVAYGSPSIVGWLNAFGVLAVISGLCALLNWVFFVSDTYDGFVNTISFYFAWSAFCGGMISGVMFFGFAKIIELLNIMASNSSK